MSFPSRRRFPSRTCLAFALLALISGTPALADYVDGVVQPLRQPDGTLISVRIWGDEFFTHVESLDGYTLIRDPQTRWICYAHLAPDGAALLSTGMVVGTTDPARLGLTPHQQLASGAVQQIVAQNRADFEARRHVGPLAPPATREERAISVGNVIGLTLLVDFSDDPATIPAANVNTYCNQVGYGGYGNNGSVRDYFASVSEGLLTYTNYVPSAYYRAQHPKSYYVDDTVQFGIRARELIVEALTHLNNQGLDFSQFDSDGDGKVDALNCFYAGSSQSAWSKGLWPHAWTVNFCADGVCTRSYQMTDMQASLRLSTFCHENGHMLLGWPDLYDYDYDSRGVGRFCIMGYSTSSTNPQEPCAYMKYRAGWGDVTSLTADQNGLIATTAANRMFKYNHPTRPNEYYLIENRHKVGRDSGLPDGGLALWHIDTQGSNNNQQQTPTSHYLVTLVQADGRWDLERNVNYGDSTDLWGAPSATQCTPTTVPNTNWWSGAASGLMIRNISVPASLVSFDFAVFRDCNANSVHDGDEIASGAAADCNTNGVPDACDIAAGDSADANANGVPDECEAPVTCAGDANCDQTVSWRDIDFFVAGLNDDQPAWQALFTGSPPCAFANLDVNGDGSVSWRDIDPFVARMNTACP